VKLWLLIQREKRGYDTYSAAVVAAETEEAARMMNPADEWTYLPSTWASAPEHVSVTYIGEAAAGITGIVVVGDPV
jgi:hypothetical protein